MRNAQRNVLLVVVLCFVGMIFWGIQDRAWNAKQAIHQKHVLHKRDEPQKRTIVPDEHHEHDGELRLYRCRSLNIQPLSEKHRSSLLERISQQTSFKKVFLKSSDLIQEVNIEDVPLASLAAIWVALGDDILGLEWDMIVPAEGERIRTTVWIEPDGNITVHEGVPHRTHIDPVDIQSLKMRYVKNVSY